MPNYSPGDVVKVPFPYTDRATHQRRPALVVSHAALQSEHDLLWVLMITSADNRGWQGDVEIADLKLAGLPVTSVIRTAKIATIDASHAQLLGKVSANVRSVVRRRLRAVFDGAVRQVRKD